MAHFAELELKQDPTGFTNEDHLVVKRVVVIGNDVSTSNGPLGENDKHVDGETYCQNLFGGGTWKQTSYNHNFRKQYAGIDKRYDSVNDVFIQFQPYASWTLDSNFDWQPPVAFPSVQTYGDGSSYYIIEWDENNQKWIGYDLDSNRFEWMPETQIWVASL